MASFFNLSLDLGFSRVRVYSLLEEIKHFPVILFPEKVDERVFSIDRREKRSEYNLKKFAPFRECNEKK